MSKAPFTLEQAEAADAWRFNCGPAAAAAILGMTPDEIRPHLLDFEAKGYTNPTLMLDILRTMGVEFRQSYRGDVPAEFNVFPRFGLVRVQWAGPWTRPGVPMRARYGATHWVAARRVDGNVEVFDINAICVGGWLPYAEWSRELVPWLLKECYPKATGEWWATHCIEVLKG